MPTFRVIWQRTIWCNATVEANSEQEAIDKAQRGEYNNDIDTEPGRDIPRSFRCEGSE